jgi:hypothetical protein
MCSSAAICALARPSATRVTSSRSRALLSDGAAADELYREAIDRLSRTQLRPELARAHLLYGEWLRREGWRVDARGQLRTAHEMLVTIGMEAFAESARRELIATGETVRKRSVETRDQLTPQEEQIARLVRDGHASGRSCSARPDASDQRVQLIGHLAGAEDVGSGLAAFVDEQSVRHSDRGPGEPGQIGLDRDPGDGEVAQLRYLRSAGRRRCGGSRPCGWVGGSSGFAGGIGHCTDWPEVRVIGSPWWWMSSVSPVSRV